MAGPIIDLHNRFSVPEAIERLAAGSDASRIMRTGGKGRNVSAAAEPPARLERLFLYAGAIGQGPSAIGNAVDVIGPERIVFGSDYAVADDILHADTRRLLARHGVDLALNGVVHVRA